MKKQRLIALILCLTLLAGCGLVGESDPEPTKKPPVSENTQPPEESEVPDGMVVEPPDFADPRPATSGTPGIVGPPRDEEETPPTSTPEQELPPEPEQEPAPDPAAQSVDSIRAAAPAGTVLAVAYLGWVEGGYAEVMSQLESRGICDALPFLREISAERFVEMSGCELYAVLPIAGDARTTVYACEFAESDISVGDELYSGGAMPLLLRGNVSDIIPNLLVAVETGGDRVEYTPSLSLENGSLSAGGGVSDCTPYTALGLNPWSENELCGEWYAQKADSTGEKRAIKLELNPDGSALYCFGVPRGETVESFEGQWRSENDVLSLTLYGGPVGDAEQAYKLSVSFRWELQGIALVCEPVGGDALLKGTWGEWYTFRPFDTFSLSGSWRAKDAASGLLYSLELAENGGCTYSVLDGAGSQQKSYEGSWRYADNAITLNMSGSGYMSGSYVAESVGNSMTLSCSYGDPLTPAMSDTGSDVFDKIDE